MPGDPTCQTQIAQIGFRHQATVGRAKSGRQPNRRDARRGGTQQSLVDGQEHCVGHNQWPFRNRTIRAAVPSYRQYEAQPDQHNCHPTRACACAIIAGEGSIPITRIADSVCKHRVASPTSRVDHQRRITEFCSKALNKHPLPSQSMPPKATAKKSMVRDNIKHRRT